MPSNAANQETAPVWTELHRSFHRSGFRRSERCFSPLCRSQSERAPSSTTVAACRPFRRHAGADRPTSRVCLDRRHGTVDDRGPRPERIRPVPAVATTRPSRLGSTAFTGPSVRRPCREGACRERGLSEHVLRLLRVSSGRVPEGRARGSAPGRRRGSSSPAQQALLDAAVSRWRSASRPWYNATIATVVMARECRQQACDHELRGACGGRAARPRDARRSRRGTLARACSATGSCASRHSSASTSRAPR